MGNALGRTTLAAGLVVVMALGSVIMWIGSPLFWVWLASQLADSSQPSFLLILLILGGIIGTMAAIGKLLGALNRYHQELTGRIPERRDQTVWMRSMRGEREVSRDHGVLATVMAVSVTFALIAMGVWFFFFAEGGGI